MAEGRPRAPARRRDPFDAERQARAERWKLARQLEAFLERPMAVLGVAWLVLLILDLTRGLTRALHIAHLTIWALFLLDFGLRLLIAPDRLRYVRRNLLTLVTLVVPALRLARALRAVSFLRAVRAARATRLVSVLGSINRGMRSARAALARRRVGLVFAMTAIVTFAGAAGVLAFEREASNGRLDDYGTALWWTAMTMTTMGADYFPVTVEGRVLGLLLATYAFAVFGFVTASIATLLLGDPKKERRARAPSRPRPRWPADRRRSRRALGHAPHRTA